MADRHTIHEFWHDHLYYTAVFSEGKLIELGYLRKPDEFYHLDVDCEPEVVAELVKSLEGCIESLEAQ